MKKLFLTLFSFGFVSFIPSSFQSLYTLSAQIPSNGLVAWYPFNGNANDESGNGNNGVVNGATLTSDRFGNSGKAFFFDRNALANISSSVGNLPLLSSSRTISAWVQWSGATLQNAGHIVNYGSAVNEGSFGLMVFGNNNWYSYSHGMNDLNSGVLANTNWVHLATTYDEQNIRKIYVNGFQVSADNIVLSTVNSDFLIGKAPYLSQASINYFDGNIDDVGVWNYALSFAEIQQLYQDQTGQVQQPLTCNITTLTTTLCAGQSATLTMNTTGGAGASSQLPANLQQGLVAYYPFNGNANDESGNGNNPSVSTIQFTEDQLGNSNSAGLFTGSEYAIVPNSSSFQINGDFSIAYSIYLGLDFPWSGWWNTKAIFTKDNDYPYGAKVFITPDGDSLSIYFGTNMWDATQSFGKKIHRNDLLGSWHHFTWTYSNNFGKLYLDGNLILVQTSNPNWGSANNLDLHIAVNGNPAGNYSYKFVGKMDNLGFWSRALSLSEVQSLVLQKSYSWSTNASTPTITVSPTTNTTYSCTVTSGSQTCTASVDITVNPAVTNAISATIAEGQSYTLGTQTLTTVGTYTEVFTSAAGCDSTVTLTLIVEPLLTCNITTPTTTLCAGQSATLTMNTTGGAGASAQLPANLQQGLVAYYPFNGNANDESGNGNNGVVNGAMLSVDRFGNNNSAFIFNGLDDKIVVAANQSLSPPNSLTVSCWAKVTDANTPNQLVSKRFADYEAPFNSYLIAEWGNDNESYFGTVNTVISNSENPISPSPLNVWIMYTLTYDGSIATFYRDGVVATAWNVSGEIVYSDLPLYLGSTGLSGQSLNGFLDEVFIYNRALSPSEIQQLYTTQSYAWSTNETTPTITVSPTTNTTYSCTVTQGDQTCTASVDIMVNPVITNAISATIVEGQSYTLGTQTLTTAGTYTEAFTSAAGCDSTVTLTLTIEPLLTCEILSNNNLICQGDSLIMELSVSSSQGNNAFLNIGDMGPAGGVIFYDKGFESNGWRYIEAMPYDLPSAPFGCYGTVLSNCNEIDLGFGASNTSAIVSQCDEIGSAARLCEDLVFGGKSDWFLPSRMELYQLYLQRNIVGGFISDGNYWSSTQQPVPFPLPDYAYFQGFQDNLVCCDGLYNTEKYTILSVRAIRYVSASEVLNYNWSNNATTPTITVSPTTNTNYSCTVTQGNQTCTASLDITVNPAITYAVSATIVEGQSYTLGAQTLTTAGTYTEVFTSAAGCDSTVTLTLAVEPLLTCEITSNSTSVCSGEELILSMNSNAADIVNVGQSTFNGQGYIQFPNAGLTGSTSRTISYRAKTSSQNIMSVLNYGGAPNNGTGLVELGMNLNMWFGAGSGYCDSITKGVSFFSNSHSVNIGKTIFDNEWHTVTYVMGENNNSSFSSIKVYVDGILVSQGENNTPYCGHNWGGWTYNTVDGPLTIGKPSAFNPYASKFVGSIADVGMWSRALTSVEVANLSGQTPAAIPLGLAHHYSLLGNAPVDLITGASGQVLGLTGSNIAWSTNETTPTITVSPTTNTTYSCTVTSGSQTCTASIDINVNPQQTYFADADGDGYGNPDVVVQDCNVPVGYVSDNTDCNDNNAAVFAASTEICNGFDDDCDGQVDEGLTIASVNATSVTTALYPTCSGNALKSANLNNGTNSDLIEGSGLDLWYSLTAQYNTLRAGLSAAFGDNEIRLYSYNNGCFELLETEHEVYTTNSLGTGNQVLITDDLIPGQTYYIAVHNISGTMNPSAKMCFNHFVGTTCDHYYSNNTGVYNNVCTSFKAQYKGNATNYIFDVLSATQNNTNLNITPWSYTTTTASSIVPRIGTIFPVNMSASAKVYALRIPVIYAIPDAAGNYTSITANATTTCTVTLNPELPISLRSTDRCPNTKNTTSSISVDRAICGALRYEWEFTQQLPSVQPAVTVLGGLNTTAFFLNNVPGMGTGKTYNVRVRPIHTNGEVGSWGSVQCLKTGTAGMVMHSENAEAWANSGTEQWANHDSPELEVSFTVYPNPTSTGRFILTANHTSDEEVKSIQMMDITGKVVFQTQVVMNNNTMEIEFGNLASGVYVLIVGEERIRLVVE